MTLQSPSIPQWLGKTIAAPSQRQPAVEIRNIAHTCAMKRAAKADDIHLVPWNEKRVIPFCCCRHERLAECAIAAPLPSNLCASAAESLSCPGHDPKLKAELFNKFTYNILSAIWMGSVGMIEMIPLNLPKNI